MKNTTISKGTRLSGTHRPGTFRKSLLCRSMAGALPTALLLVIAAPGHAGNRDDAWSLSPFVGGHDFDNQQALETSPVFGLRTGYNFTPRWAAELSLGYTLAESEVANYPESDIYDYSLDALYHFNPDGKLVPFLAVGIGGNQIDMPAPGFAGSNDEVINFGVGVKYFIAESVALRGDVRELMANESSDANLVYTVGVTFLMGGKPETVEAQCTPSAAGAAVADDTTPPYVTLVAPFHAATDISVHRVVRAAFSEPIDPKSLDSRTFTVWQGKTQIEGTVVAPTGTTLSFSHPANFLPATTYTARIRATVKDLAGNAMASDHIWSFTTETAAVAGAGKAVVIDRLITLEDTHFKFDSAVLTPEGEKALEQNIQYMHDNPKLTARIAGYSSASGTTEYNQALSERRANTVMAYIVDHGGVAAERLDSIGYGETRPAMYEELPEELRSKEAKANMRVLFEVIVK